MDHLTAVKILDKDVVKKVNISISEVLGCK